MEIDTPTNEQLQENNYDETYLHGLLTRISGLEKEQKLSRTQIQRLAADKKRIKQMLHDLAKERNTIKNRHAQQETINADLIVEIQNKALEEKKLRQQLEEIQRKAEEEINKLREERDVALALIENKTKNEHFLLKNRKLIIIGFIAVFAVCCVWFIFY
ncbi:MAG: hypothetical protein RIT27_2403 [Pseudomonadota bacterium]|jgi:septal ring factor EnvC (AmiA/AmiB activator)